MTSPVSSLAGRPTGLLLAVGVLTATLAASSHATSIAVVIGVDYAGARARWAKDAVNVANALAATGDFLPGNVHRVAGPGGTVVTRDAILGAITNAAVGAHAGDASFFY
ncbi:MAG: hypothetical protein H6977_18895 [Gammaproteobacteria bacterium]|nr:hypothetical protein [Gammaproteobacteria bacterium]MCP5202070.1 hypothetical protein [Gammaproteobacteria bacterium]